MVLQQYTTNISIQEKVEKYINLLENNVKYYCPVINQSNYLDTYIYKLVMYHLTEKNIKPTNFTIQYELQQKKNLQIEYNKQKKNSPLFTILCYDSQCNSPILFTDINIEEYKYKEFKNQNNVYIYFPRKNAHTLFDGSKYYGVLNNDKETTEKYLKINVWNEDGINNLSPFLNTNYQDNLEFFENIQFYEKNEELVEMNEYNYNDNTFEKIIMNTTDSSVNVIFSKIFQNKKENENFISVKFIKKEGYNYLKLISEHGDIIKGFLEIVDEKGVVNENNICYKNKIIQNILPKEVCYWILNDCFKYTQWKISSYKNYEYQANLELFPYILNYILFISNFWLLEIRKLYSIPPKINLNIKEIFIAKYTANKIITEKTADGGFLIMNIQLNDEVEYSYGDINFNHANYEEESIKLKKTDCIIYNGKRLRTPGHVGNGEKFVLVIIIELLL